MKKIVSIIIAVLLLSLNLANAITQQELSKAKSLIESKADCKTLSESQLEIIGEYYMEQMMPGLSHERAHEMMGLQEGSEAEEQFHINLGKNSYCGENVGMMDSGIMSGGGMMSGEGMMGNNYQTPLYNNTSLLIKERFEIFFYIMLTLVIVVLILVIILLINKAKQKGRKTK